LSLTSCPTPSATTGRPRRSLPDHRGQHRPPVRVPPAGLGQRRRVDRGAAFLIIGASIARQFEFLQRVWGNDGDFVGLGAEKDPLIGANDGTGTFTIPRKPFRRRVKGLPRFITTRGGEYCFLPGIRALQRIAEGQ
jgi:hypothetical protein